MVVTLGILAAASIEGLFVHGACRRRRIFVFDVPSAFIHDCSRRWFERKITEYAFPKELRVGTQRKRTQEARLTV
jgi:hypothetical protein